MLRMSMGALNRFSKCKYLYKFAKLNINKFSSYSKSATYYNILGVEKNASVSEIKEAFVKLSKKLHPDMNPNNNPNDFIKLNEAYSVLIRPSSRREYDLKIATNQMPENMHGMNINDMAEQIRRQQWAQEEYYSKYGIKKDPFTPTASDKKVQFKTTVLGMITIIVVILGFVYPYALFAARYKSGLYTPLSSQDEKMLREMNKKIKVSKDDEKKIEQFKSNNPAFKIFPK